MQVFLQSEVIISVVTVTVTREVLILYIMAVSATARASEQAVVCVVSSVRVTMFCGVATLFVVC